MKAISFMNRYKPFTNGYHLNKKALAFASAFIFNIYQMDEYL